MEEFKPNAPKTPSAQYSPQKNDIQPTIMMIEEKINLILKYQRRAAHMETARTIMSIIIFIIFVVLPIVGSFYLYDQLKGKIDLGKLATQYQDMSQKLNDVQSTVDKAAKQ